MPLLEVPFQLSWRPLSYWKAAMRSLWNLLEFEQSQPPQLSLTGEVFPPIIFVALTTTVHCSFGRALRTQNLLKHSCSAADSHRSLEAPEKPRSTRKAKEPLSKALIPRCSPGCVCLGSSCSVWESLAPLEVGWDHRCVLCHILECLADHLHSLSSSSSDWSVEEGTEELWNDQKHLWFSSNRTKTLW